MKKAYKTIESVILSIFLMLCFCLPFVKNLNSFQNQNAIAAKLSEDDFQNVTDLVGTDEEKLKLVFGESSLTLSPFNPKTGSLNEGKSVTPTFDEFNQTKGASFPFESSEILEENESIFLWIYIPADTLEVQYSLTISLRFLTGAAVTWEFDVSKLDNMCDEFPGSMSVSFGWKLFELNLGDCTSSSADKQTLKNTGVTGMTISYCDALGRETISDYPKRAIAVYHVFKAISKSGTSGIIDNLNFSYFKVKQSFSNSVHGIYNGDSKVLANSIADIFEYVYVGKDDLSKAVAENFGYFWQLKVNRNGTKIDYSFGDKFNFATQGDYSFEISLKEDMLLPSLVLYTEPIYVNEFTLGSFNLPDYMVENGQTKRLVFTISNGFVFDGDIVVRCSDNSTATVTYYKQGNKLNIDVKGLKKGSVNIYVQALGNREGHESELFVSRTVVRVNASTTSNFTQILLWTCLGIMCAALLSMLVISVVKARKNSVK